MGTTKPRKGHGFAALAAAALLAGCATAVPAPMPIVLAALPADGRAALVGHSMAGMVISAAAKRAPGRIGTLVYVAAYLPQNGESPYQLSVGDADSLVGMYRTQAKPKAYSPATVRAEGIAEVFCADCTAAKQQNLVAAHRAEAVPPLGTPVVLSSACFGSVPRVYVHTLKHRAVTYGLQQRMLAAAGGAARVVTLDTSRLPMLTQPRAVAEVIADAAR